MAPDPTPTAKSPLPEYRDALVALARERGKTGPAIITLPDAQAIERRRGDPETSANVALHYLVNEGTFVRECLGDGGAPVRQERVERLLAILVGPPGEDRTLAEEEARAIQVRWRLVGGGAS